PSSHKTSLKTSIASSKATSTPHGSHANTTAKTTTQKHHSSEQNSTRKTTSMQLLDPMLDSSLTTFFAFCRRLWFEYREVAQGSDHSGGCHCTVGCYWHRGFHADQLWR